MKETWKSFIKFCPTDKPATVQPIPDLVPGELDGDQEVEAPGDQEFEAQAD